MIGEFITRSLLLVLGYAYPAFQCFKAIEKNRVEIPELRFWCQYWIIVAVITILEKIGDVFILWLPMYGEMKLALFIYLWYPKTKGCGYVYETLLRPYVSKRETDIDKSLLEFREGALNLAIYYWNNCTELGTTQILQFVTSQSQRISTLLNSENVVVNQQPNEAPPPAPPSKPPVLPSEFSSSHHGSETPKSESIQVHLRNRPDDVLVPDLGNGTGLEPKSDIEQDLYALRRRIQHYIDGNN